MNLKIEKKANVYIILLGGKFTLIDTEEFENKFVEVIDAKPIAIGIDCSGLEFIDSSGIGAFIKCLNHAKRTSTGLHLISVNKNILNVLKLAKLDLFFSIIEYDEFIQKYPGSDDSGIENLI
jgi:anti-anti-sigma factor